MMDKQMTDKISRALKEEDLNYFEYIFLLGMKNNFAYVQDPDQ